VVEVEVDVALRLAGAARILELRLPPIHGWRRPGRRQVGCGGLDVLTDRVPDELGLASAHAGDDAAEQQPGRRGGRLDADHQREACGTRPRAGGRRRMREGDPCHLAAGAAVEA
jgi:hypothetical protein